MKLLLVLVLLGFSIAGGTLRAQATLDSSTACRVRPVIFDGWKAQEVSNKWVRLVFVPLLGGRLMQVSFNGHPYLFINPKTMGKYVPPSEANGKWINYGGDKVWPMPEGNQDEQHWVLQSSPLDDGPYIFTVLSRSPRCAVQLKGPPDPLTGLQYTREISIGPNSPEISFHAVMKNFTDHPISWSMQSVSQYNLAAADDPAQYNPKFWAIAPLRADSTYLGGYHVVDGLANDPSFHVKDGIFSLNWKYLQNEVWLDSTGGWIAVVDAASGYAMAETFRYFSGLNYPGKATVIFYKNGPGIELDDKGFPQLTSADPEKNPYYMEAELNSPIVILQPGSTYAMDTDWHPSRINENVRNVTHAGIVALPFAISKTPNGTHAMGEFGVFFPGRLQAYMYDEHGIQRKTIPLQTVDPKEKITMDDLIEIPPAIARVSLHLVSSSGVDYGSLGEAFTAQAKGSE